MVDMVTLHKEEIICVVLAHRTFMFILTISLTLTFGLAHKTCICSSCLLLTSQSLSVSILSFWLSSWLTRLVYVHLVYCLGLTELVRFSKSPWLASGWLFKASYWRITLEAAFFNSYLCHCNFPLLKIAASRDVLQCEALSSHPDASQGDLENQTSYVSLRQ